MRQIDVVGERVVLFDGDCNVCDRSVNWLLSVDRREILKFASLQSGYGRELCRVQEDIPTDGNSVVLFVKDRSGVDSVYIETDAIIKICSYLPYPWRLGTAMKFIPRPIRNYPYRYFASRRYRWFGKKEQCMVPTSDMRARFLD